MRSSVTANPTAIVRRAIDAQQPPLAAWVARSPARALGTMGVLFFACFFIGGVFWLDTVRSAEQLLEVRGRPVEGLVLSKAIATTLGAGKRPTPPLPKTLRSALSSNSAMTTGFRP